MAALNNSTEALSTALWDRGFTGAYYSGRRCSEKHNRSRL